MVFLFIKDNRLVLLFTLFVWLKLLYFNYQIGTLKGSTLFYIFTFFTASAPFLIALFFSKRKRQITIILSLLISILIIANLAYFRFYGSAISAQSFLLASSATKVPGLDRLFRIEDILFFLDILVFSQFFVIKRKKRNIDTGVTNKHRLYLNTFTILITVAVLFSILFYDRNTYLNLYLNNVSNNTTITERYGLLGEQLIDIYKTAKSYTYRIDEKGANETIKWIKENKQNKQGNNSFTNIAKGKNVITIQFESLENSMIGRYVDGQELTPNLNKLLATSHYFDNNYFELGLGNTSDSDFTANTSLYPLKDSSVFVRYGNNNFTSLPKILKENGYSVDAFHAYVSSFWNRKVAFESLGFDNFYSRENYPSGKNIGMGLNDVDFFSHTADLISKEKKPFYSFIFTLSSHYSFEAIGSDQTLDINKDDHPSLLHGYYQTLHYSDNALGIFIEDLKKRGLWDESIIMLYGDHYTNKGNLNDPAVLKGLGYPEGPLDIQQDLDLKKTPLLIHLPGQTQDFVHHEVSSTIDQMPTILNLLGIKTEVPMFGRDLFGDDPAYFSSVLYFGDGIITDGNYLYKAGTYKELESGKCFQHKNDELVLTKVSDCKNLFERKADEFKYNEMLIEGNLFDRLK